MGYRLTPAERETVIRRAADERQWSVFTEDPVVIRKLDKLFHATEVTTHGKRYKIPLGAISFRQPRKLSPRQLEQLEAARAKMAKVSAKRTGGPEGFTPGGGDPYPPTIHLKIALKICLALWGVLTSEEKIWAWP
ncbi:MAG: hypothetical protein HY673_12470 [Chloroflexi bacterium]|nr:hypothetical protein [Chloroflexota bacterium]